MAIHVQRVAAAGHVAEAFGIGRCQVGHDRKVALGLRTPSGVIDIGYQEAFDAFLQPVDHVALGVSIAIADERERESGVFHVAEIDIAIAEGKLVSVG